MDVGFGRGERDVRRAAEQQWRRVRGNLTKYAEVIAGVIFKCRTGRVTMGSSSYLLRGIDVSLRDKSIEGNGQEQHAQHKCASRRSRQPARLNSLFPRQQLNIQPMRMRKLEALL